MSLQAAPAAIAERPSCQCPRCGRMHHSLLAGDPPPVIRTADLAGWMLDAARNQARKNGKTVTLKPNVFKLAFYLAERPNQVVSREMIGQLLASGLWSNYRNADCYVKRVRQALGFVQKEKPIVTHYGIGWEYVP